MACLVCSFVHLRLLTLVPVGFTDDGPRLIAPGHVLLHTVAMHCLLTIFRIHLPIGTVSGLGVLHVRL